MAFDPLTTLPVRITYGSGTQWRLGEKTFSNVDEVGRLMRLGAAEAEEIIVDTPVDVLRLGGQVDLLDTPGVGSDDRADRISAEVLKSLDAVVLVVRYPALFTRVTRHLMKELQNDIGKLFVVWNLDADCAELTAEERARHADRLREDVAGAHELYLVDARAGLRAQLSGDAKSLADSGLDEFISALGRFASSDKRELTALREAAKRGDQWIEEAYAQLRARRESLQIKLRQVQARLQKVESGADAERQAATDQFDGFQSAVEVARKKRSAAAHKAVAAFRRSLRKARRTWAWRGEVEPLREALRGAAETYGDAVTASVDEFRRAVSQAGQDFGISFAAADRERVVLSTEEMAPDERLALAAAGRMLWLRRTLWRRWYLPGVAELERNGIDSDLVAQDNWENSASGQAEARIRAVFEKRVAEIGQRAASEVARIVEETNFEAEESELAALEQHIPVVEARRDSVNEINREAWNLVG
jgi:hypothetical protein